MEKLVAHLFCVIAIGVLGVTGSAFSIYVYANKTPKTVGGTFIIALAILDIFSCIVVPPLIPIKVFKKNHILMEILFFLLPLMISVYLMTLTTIALDRAVAVLRPFAYNNSPKRTLAIIINVLLFGIGLSTGTYIADIIFKTDQGIIARYSLAFTIVVSFAVISISYSMIIYKLRKQTKRVGVKPQREQNDTVPSTKLTIVASS